jgi:hypothetical protein
MRKLYFLITSTLLFLSQIGNSQSDLIITGLLDGDLPGGLPKAIELYAVNDIADLSVYGLGSANNGGGTDGVEFNFPADALTAGDFVYVTTDNTAFNDFFGFEADYVDGPSAGINGDDAVELFFNDGANDILVDVYGVQDVNGDGEVWDYTDSWSYRQDGTGTNTGAGVVFNPAEWSFLGLGGLDGETSNATASSPFPVGTYMNEGGGGDMTVTIQEIQETVDPDGASPLEGEAVTTSGIVTGVEVEDGFWIQDGTGAWSGVFVRQNDPTVAVGDDVTVSGTVQENFDLTRINNVTEVVVNSSGNALPAPEVLTTGTVGVEDWEGVLVQLDAVTCINDDLGFGEWLVDDGSGAYRVDDGLYDANPQIFVGYDLVGIAHFTFGDFKLWPRDMNDVAVNASASTVGISFASSEEGISEDGGTLTVNVQIFNAPATETTVEVAVTGGTAVNGTNYNFTDPTTLTFPAGATADQTFDVEITDDLDPNEDRTIELTLQNATNDAAFGTSVLTITIDDNDTEVVITDVAVVAENDADGFPVNFQEEFTVEAVVYGVNLNGSGQQFTLRDATGGIGVFSSTVVDDYVVTEGDLIRLTGTVGFFNGLTQLNPTAIQFISADNPLEEPVVVTELTEANESQLIKLECVFLTEPGQWSGAGSGFNVTVSNGTQEYQVRIDNEVDLYSLPAPEGTFDVTGIGGQFDNESPYDSGYQLLPRRSEDIVAADCGIVTPPINDDCLAGIDVDDLLGGPIGLAQVSSQYTNAGASPADSDVTAGFDCFAEDGGPSLDNNVWFTFVGDGNSYLIETNDCGGTAEEYIPNGNTQMAVYSGLCGFFATPVACSEDGPNANPDNLAAGVEVTTIAGLNYQVMIDGFDGAAGDFCLSFTRLPLANDECEGAVDLTDLTGGDLDVAQTSGAFTNVGATSVDDPDVNAEETCFFGAPLLSNTVWFSFEGDGNEYFIETVNCGEVTDYIDDGDTQMAIYTGDCDNLLQVACNEDGPQATSEEFPAGITFATEEGVTYTVLVDGYQGADGEFCMQMTLTEFLSVSENSDFEFKAYPNPASDVVVIESPVVLQNVALTNVLGQRVKEWNITNAERFELNTSGMEPGVYLLQATSEGKISTLKLIIE